MNATIFRGITLDKLETHYNVAPGQTFTVNQGKSLWLQIDTIGGSGHFAFTLDYERVNGSGKS